MNTTQQCTPGPWECARNGDDWFVQDKLDCIVSTTFCYAGDMTGRSHEANAAFIVEACNNYERVCAERDEFAKALRQIAEEMSAPDDEPETPEDGDDYMLGLWHAAQIARAALANRVRITP